MPTHVRGIAGPVYSEEEMTTAALSYNGTIVEGWVKSPGKGWEPKDGDLIWLPPGAMKSTDIDGIGRVVDVGPWTPGGDMAWVQAQLDKANRYWELVKQKVRAGKYRMTAGALRAMGFDEDEIARLTGAELTPRTLTGGPVPAYKAATDLQRMLDRTGPAMPDPSRVRAIASAAADRFAATGDMQAAIKGIYQAVRTPPAPVDPDTGLPVVR